ncbi:interleukin-1 family member A isoform X2 [Alosa alosa]|uniref:interleukin-1 family member A isoform X2 n=1 Tax=Alosa alosa TaxID=278164 RepID=UPI0020152EA9|nr:interleukin-1 family member A isoform X2 [Alosa alosa]
MEVKDTPVNGGVSILHTVRDGKHYYEVETVLKDKKAKKGFFMRRGDKLLKINGLDLQDLSPEMFAEKLSEGSPMLTLHQPSPDHSEKPHQTPGALCPVKKEDYVLDFCLNTSRDPDVCSSDENLQVEDDCDQEDDILLLVEMVDTNMSVVRGRGCAHGETCEDCGGTDCNLDEVVMTSRRVSLVARGISDFLHDKIQENIALEGLLSRLYVNPVGDQTRLKTNPAKITIYYYQSNHVDGSSKGVPVVLNFSGTDKFIRCSRHPDSLEAIINVTPYEKSKLKCISKEDHESLAFVFYMKGGRARERIFESAHCEGFFIHSNNRAITATRQNMDDTFYFIIHEGTFMQSC